MIENKIDTCDEETLKQNETVNQIMEQLSCENLNFSLDLQEFERLCYQINEILIEHNYFLRLIQKYNGFQVIKSSFSKRETKI